MTGILQLMSPVLLALVPIVAGTPAESSTATNFKQCVQLEVPIPVVATNHYYSMPQVDSTIDAIEWAVNATTWSTLNATARVTGEKHINETFRINAQLCVPTQKGPKASILQIATPGLGYDKRYFDVEIRPEDYSYVYAAVKKGYSVLSYDRLGTGLSDIPNAYDTVQIPTEVEILAGLTKLARSGKLISSSKVLSATASRESKTDTANLSDFTPSKVVQVGHSFGSFLGALVLARYGTLSDGALFTGFFLSNWGGTVDVSHFDHEFAAEHDPARFGRYPSGYFVLNTPAVLQKLFFKKGSFESELLLYNEKIKQPEAVGEYASEGTSGFEPALEFKGPVLTFTGEFDYFNCGGDCRGTYDKNMTEGIFPASHVEPYLQPRTGHTLTLATNSSAGYEVMLQYLASHGL